MHGTPTKVCHSSSLDTPLKSASVNLDIYTACKIKWPS